jgi:hypothetical protein
VNDTIITLKDASNFKRHAPQKSGAFIETKVLFDAFNWSILNPTPSTGAGADISEGKKIRALVAAKAIKKIMTAMRGAMY